MEGISLRDWFAGRALNGILSSAGVIAPGKSWAFEEIAEISYGIADAMVKRSKNIATPLSDKDVKVHGQ